MHYFCPQNKMSIFLFKTICLILLTTSRFDSENDVKRLKQNLAFLDIIIEILFFRKKSCISFW